MMKTDIEIAQNADMKKITEIAEKIGLTEDDIELYGKYKCKINLDVFDKNKSDKKGKLVLMGWSGSAICYELYNCFLWYGIFMIPFIIVFGIIFSGWG